MRNNRGPLREEGIDPLREGPKSEQHKRREKLKEKPGYRIAFFIVLGVILFIYVPFLIGGEVFGYDTDWLTDLF